MSNEQETEETNSESEACSTVQNQNSLQESEYSASITYNNNEFGDIPKFENTNKVLEMSASDWVTFEWNSKKSHKVKEKD